MQTRCILQTSLSLLKDQRIDSDKLQAIQWVYMAVRYRWVYDTERTNPASEWGDLDLPQIFVLLIPANLTYMKSL